MEALTAIRQRRAVRTYTDTPVPEEDVAEVVRLALHAPTGHGAQAWSFVVVRDEEKRAALADLVLRGAGEYFRTFRPAKEGSTPEEHAQWAKEYAAEVLGTYRVAPVWICAITVPRFTYDDPMMEKIERFSDSTSVAFAFENLLIAARALGLGTTPTMFHLYFEDEYRALLELPEGVELHYVTPLGYPPEFPKGLRPAMAKARRPWRSLVHEDSWSSLWADAEAPAR